VNQILHLEDDEGVRTAFKNAVQDHYEIISCTSTEEALERGNKVSLYVCGPLGKHWDGILFALEKQSEGVPVLVLDESRKFSKLPFLSTSRLRDPGEVIQKIITILTKG
jgi:DNA-binding NtrC family response regulator